MDNTLIVCDMDVVKSSPLIDRSKHLKTCTSFVCPDCNQMVGDIAEHTDQYCIEKLKSENKLLVDRLSKQTLRSNLITFESIRKYLDPLFETIDRKDIKEMITNFFSNPNAKKEFFFGAKECREYILPNTATIDVFRGDLSGDHLTYNKLMCYLGYKNRQFVVSGDAVEPNFWRMVTISNKFPNSFKYYLHFGIQFTFRESSEEVRRDIIIAINLMDMCLINFRDDRLKSGLIYRSIAHVIDSRPPIYRPLYTDLVKTAGRPLVKETEEKYSSLFLRVFSDIRFIYRKEL